MQRIIRLGAVAAIAALSLSLAGPQEMKPIEVGDTVAYSFRDALVNGMGMTSLSDLRGKPVLLEYWGHR